MQLSQWLLAAGFTRVPLFPENLTTWWRYWQEPCFSLQLWEVSGSTLLQVFLPSHMPLSSVPTAAHKPHAGARASKKPCLPLLIALSLPQSVWSSERHISLCFKLSQALCGCMWTPHGAPFVAEFSLPPASSQIPTQRLINYKSWSDSSDLLLTTSNNLTHTYPFTCCHMTQGIFLPLHLTGHSSLLFLRVPPVPRVPVYTSSCLAVGHLALH